MDRAGRRRRRRWARARRLAGAFRHRARRTRARHHPRRSPGSRRQLRAGADADRPRGRQAAARRHARGRLRRRRRRHAGLGAAAPAPPRWDHRPACRRRGRHRRARGTFGAPAVVTAESQDVGALAPVRRARPRRRCRRRLARCRRRRRRSRAPAPARSRRSRGCWPRPTTAGRLAGPRTPPPARPPTSTTAASVLPPRPAVVPPWGGSRPLPSLRLVHASCAWRSRRRARALLRSAPSRSAAPVRRRRRRRSRGWTRRPQRRLDRQRGGAVRGPAASRARCPSAPARLACVPRVTATARPQALFHSEPLVVYVPCAAACRSPRHRRAAPPGLVGPAGGARPGRRQRGPARRRPMCASASRPCASWNHIFAPPRVAGGPRRRARHGPGGRAPAPMLAHRARRCRSAAAPCPRSCAPPLDVRARRAGTAVVVVSTWRTAGPARRMCFLAFTRRTRGRSFAPVVLQPLRARARPAALPRAARAPRRRALRPRARLRAGSAVRGSRGSSCPSADRSAVGALDRDALEHVRDRLAGVDGAPRAMSKMSFQRITTIGSMPFGEQRRDGRRG